MCIPISSNRCHGNYNKLNYASTNLALAQNHFYFYM